MNTFDAIRTVLAVRQYQDKPVPAEVVRRIIEAGWLTASAKNAQPWHFVLVDQREALQKLGALVRSGPYIAGAAFAVVVVVERTPFAVSDGSRAIQSMILAAWSEGVGSNWAGFHVMPEVNALLGIPADLDVLAVVPFGYPVAALGQGKKQRKPLTQVAHHQKFGQPYR